MPVPASVFSLNGVFAVSVVMILLAGALAVVLAWWAFRRPTPHRKAKVPKATPKISPTGKTPPRPQTGIQPSAPDTAPSSAADAAPPELAAFRWLKLDDLDTARQATLMNAIKGIPRPPQSLQQLLSPEFVARAGSGELSELIMTEPMIAAKVISTVNAPYYGMHTPVTNIGQAVTFLGINTVRNICLQYMLAEAFRPRQATSQKAFDSVWLASAIASELCVRLSKALQLPDQGNLSTQVVLGFVGHLSAASLMPPESLSDWLSLGRLARAEREQSVMDLSASEIGALLMHAWGLPEPLVNGVREMDRILITPPTDHPTVDASRKALGYLCARLGERLALGQLASMEDYDPLQDLALDTHCLNLHLRNPMLRRLPAVLASADVQEAMRQMLKGAPTQKA